MRPATPATTATRSLFLGSFIQSKNLDELEYWHEAAVAVDEEGAIVGIEKEDGVGKEKAGEVLLARLGWSREGLSVRSAREGEFYFPGFVGMCVLFRLQNSGQIMRVLVVEE